MICLYDGWSVVAELDARTLAPPRDDAPVPGNRDLLWLQTHATWREGREQR